MSHCTVYSIIRQVGCVCVCVHLPDARVDALLHEDDT
jgi:hypothetical protein